MASASAGDREANSRRRGESASSPATSSDIEQNGLEGALIRTRDGRFTKANMGPTFAEWRKSKLAFAEGGDTCAIHDVAETSAKEDEDTSSVIIEPRPSSDKHGIFEVRHSEGHSPRRSGRGCVSVATYHMKVSARTALHISHMLEIRTKASQPAGIAKNRRQTLLNSAPLVVQSNRTTNLAASRLIQSDEGEQQAIGSIQRRQVHADVRQSLTCHDTEPPPRDEYLFKSHASISHSMGSNQFPLGQSSASGTARKCDRSQANENASLARKRRRIAHGDTRTQRESSQVPTPINSDTLSRVDLSRKQRLRSCVLPSVENQEVAFEREILSKTSAIQTDAVVIPDHIAGSVLVSPAESILHNISSSSSKCVPRSTSSVSDLSWHSARSFTSIDPRNDSDQEKEVNVAAGTQSSPILLDLLQRESSPQLTNQMSHLGAKCQHALEGSLSQGPVSEVSGTGCTQISWSRSPESCVMQEKLFSLADVAEDFDSDSVWNDISNDDLTQDNDEPVVAHQNLLVSELPGPEPKKVVSKADDYLESDDYYVPSRIVAERARDSGQREYCIAWENYQGDETWEPENSIMEDAPGLVAEWNLRKERIRANLEDDSIGVAKKIHYRKLKQGSWFYGVEWEGCPERHSWTWEPCEQLKTDDPEVVEAYEKNRRWTKKMGCDGTSRLVKTIHYRCRRNGTSFFRVEWEGSPEKHTWTWEHVETMRRESLQAVKTYQEGMKDKYRRKTTYWPKRTRG